MIAAELSALKTPIFISEIFPLTISQPNILCFRLTPDVNENAKDLGNRLSFHLSRQFPDVAVTWHQGDFITLAKPGQSMPDPSEWREALERIRGEVKDFGDRPWGIQWVRHPNLTPTVLAQLACQVLQTDCRFSHVPVLLPAKESQRVIVRREAEFWSEVIELENTLTPALSLSIHSSILFKGNLAEFFQNHPSRQNPEKLLVGLHVQSLETGGHGIIREIVGTIGEKKEELLKWATGSTSKQALREAPDEQPVVGVQFGKNPKMYEYAMAALRPRVTDDTDERFGVQHGQLLRATKIRDFKDRTQLLARYKEEASQALVTFGFQLRSSINSRKFSSHFWYPKTPIDQTPLLFGKGYVGKQGQILNGLKIKNGGVYRRHPDYASRPIQIAVLKLCDLQVSLLLKGVENCLRDYGFTSQIIHKQPLTVSGSDASARAELEKALNEVAVLSPDVVLIFLPESDRSADKSDGGSLYQFAYSHLLRRQTASQFIYADTLKKVQSGQILNQVVPGILAKLGNLPFILAEPLEVADYFIGLDISRSPKSRLAGTMNACASVRLYGKQGEFVRYRLEDGLLEGEEIPQRMLERLLPASELDGKTVLIYRDGRFCGKEVTNLLERANAINAQFVLVECIKSGVPRLYHLNDKVLAAPETGLALRLSSKEAILVTTKVSPNVGLARPLRLRVNALGHPAAIEQVVETTLKLTLLHHGALKTPRLPMPLHGADRMAYLRINGIYPSILEGDHQFWL
jgi:Piwi domain